MRFCPLRWTDIHRHSIKCCGYWGRVLPWLHGSRNDHLRRRLKAVSARTEDI
jgi:hypothetical protein